jgi:hypothetical protein
MIVFTLDGIKNKINYQSDYLATRRPFYSPLEAQHVRGWIHVKIFTFDGSFYSLYGASLSVHFELRGLGKSPGW